MPNPISIPLDDLDAIVLVRNIDDVNAYPVFSDEPTCSDYDEYFRQMDDSELLDLPEEILHSIAAEDVLFRIKALKPNLLSSSQNKLLIRWQSFPYKDAKTNVPHLLEMLSRLLDSQFMIMPGVLNTPRKLLGRPAGIQEIIRDLDMTHFQGPEVSPFELAETFLFRLPTQERLNTKQLEVRIKIIKEPVDRAILALTSLSEVAN